MKHNPKSIFIVNPWIISLVGQTTRRSTLETSIADAAGWWSGAKSGLGFYHDQSHYNAHYNSHGERPTTIRMMTELALFYHHPVLYLPLPNKPEKRGWREKCWRMRGERAGRMAVCAMFCAPETRVQAELNIM